ncbi:MAG: hypothetical protein ACOC5M_01210 [Chloroflexota bacterium]
MALHFDIDPKLQRRLETAAKLRGTTLNDWAREAIEEKLEREVPDLAGDDQDALSGALKRAAALHPLIEQGSAEGMDAGADLNDLRDERLCGIGE